MFPNFRLLGYVESAIPRVSGGVSWDRGSADHARRYSPRQRGCFHYSGGYLALVGLFPASAGVFPPVEIVEKSPLPIPRVSGGVSLFRSSSGMASCYSPRQRGCFHNEIPSRQFCRLFPASAGVFPRPPLSDVNCPDYSPRQRGCFPTVGHFTKHGILFPASAGVFPHTRRARCLNAPIPRVSGGVSKYMSPLRTKQALFPASAGVFPTAKEPHEYLDSIPRVSGGVSTPIRRKMITKAYSPRQRGYLMVEEVW